MPNAVGMERGPVPPGLSPAACPRAWMVRVWLSCGDHVAESGFVAQGLCDFFDLVGCGAWCEDCGLGREVVRWRAFWVGFVSYGQVFPRFGVRASEYGSDLAVGVLREAVEL
jgi:hypothetical protein